jgi:hypothetical protein
VFLITISIRFNGNTDMKYLETPRQRHYVLGHEAFRQMCEHDPHQFFELMASPAQQSFIKELVSQVELNFPIDVTVLDIDSIQVTTSLIDNRPLIIIKMPPAEAYVECVYVGIVSMMDINVPQSTPHPEICYFTLELGQGEEKDEECRVFCQWLGDTHYNLAEMSSSTSREEFALVIKQRIDQIN